MWLFGWPRDRKSDPAFLQLQDNLEEAEIRHLEVLRREVANLIVVTDPDLMVRCYERAWKWEDETAKSPERLRADEVALVTKIKAFEDFDLICTRHFIPYVKSIEMISDEDIVERYLDIGRMLVIMKNRSKIDAVRRRPLHDEHEHKVLLDNMRGERDRRFRARIKDALERFYAYRQGFGAGKDDYFAGLYETFSDANLEVFRIHRDLSPENETGVVFKKTDEYGIYSSFTHDDGHVTESYYRTDKHFGKREHLIN